MIGSEAFMRRRKSTGRGLSLQRLLYDRRAQDAIGRAGAAARDVYRRARGESAREAVTDKKLGRRLQQAFEAGWDAWSAVAEPPRRRPRPRVLLVLSLGGAGVFLAANRNARQKLLAQLPGRQEDTAAPESEPWSGG